MEKTLWDDILHLIVQRKWLNATHGEDYGNYWFDFYTKDQGVPSIKIHIYVYKDGRIFIRAGDPSLSISRVSEFLEDFRQLFSTFEGVDYNQENGTFSFHPKIRPRPNIIEVEKAIYLCINAVKGHHRALNAAKQAILNSGKINP